MIANGYAGDERQRAGVLEEAGSRWLPGNLAWLDAAVYTVLIGIGVLELFLSQRSDFYFDDVSYLERGLSLLHNHFYGLNGIAEHTQPPGFPILVGLISMLLGSTHTILLHAMAVFNTLGLLATYALLRREQSREVAAAICLLLASSMPYFLMATRAIWPEYPYMLVSVGVLLAVRKADTAAGWRFRTWWAFVAALLLATALMIHSTGIALIGGLLAWMGTAFLADRRMAVRRLKTFLPVVLVGLAMQGWWMHLASPTSDWPIPGYPASYVSQLKLKSGNFPELGMASVGDVVARAAHNLYDRTRVLTELITHQWIVARWFSPALPGMIILVALGIGEALWPTGESLLGWYLLCLEGMYILWPWSFDIRFLLPATPFAAMFAWRGVQTIRRLAMQKPNLMGGAGLLVAATALGTPATLWALGAWSPSVLPGLLEAGLSILAWLGVALVCAWMTWKGRVPSMLFGSCFRERMYIRSLGALLVSLLVVLGIGQQIAVGRRNIHFVIDEVRQPDVAGAEWIAAHTPPNAVVLARQVPIVTYYAKRTVYWLPPISRPAVLLDGIQKRNVKYVLVVKHDDPYYLPDDPDCFAPLLVEYPGAFRPAASEPLYTVYEVLK
jgi:hypothetical protein